MEQSSLGFLEGGGEMGALVRARDWCNTPLGAPANWPKSLQTALALILHSKFPMFIWWGPDLLCFYNDAYRPSLGKEGKHPGILGQPAETAWAEIWPVIHPLIKQVLDGGEATWSEDQLIPIYRNGRLEDVYWTFSYSRINNDEGIANGILVTCVETTQKVLNQNKIQEIAEQLQFATEAAELGAWDYNPKTAKFRANNRLKNWFGIMPDEETDLQVAINAIAEYDRDRVIQAIAASLDYEQQKPYDIEYTIVNKITGKETIVLVKGKAYYDEHKTAYRFSGTMEDITDRVRARTKLREMQERARLAVAAGNLGTYDWEIGGEKIVMSERFCEIFGVAPDAGRQTLQDRIHPDDLPRRNEALIAAMASGDLHYEVRVVHENGSIRWVRFDGKVVKNGDRSSGKMHIVGIAMDITDLKENEQKLEEYIAIASHELRNPLTSLKLSLDILPSIEKESDRKYFINKSREQVQRLIALTNGVLNVSKISSGLLDITPEVFQLESAISDSIATVGEGISMDRFQMSGSTDISVVADRFRIEQVLVNLLSNALKYSPKGTPVSVYVENEPGYIKVVVRDSGIGIDEDKISKVFQKFSRLEPSIGIDGYGLGLYISEQIIRRHGGEMGVESKKGKGSSFWFTLPQ